MCAYNARYNITMVFNVHALARTTPYSRSIISIITPMVNYMRIQTHLHNVPLLAKITQNRDIFSSFFYRKTYNNGRLNI